MEESPIDPENFSVLPPDLDNLHQVGTNMKAIIFRDQDTGRIFYLPVGDEEEPRMPNLEDQMFLSKLLKGTMPVSDIVKIGDAGYSYEVIADDEQIPEQETADSINADVYILNVIFRDGDHHLQKNVAIKEGKSYVFFDFEGFVSFWKTRKDYIAKEKSDELQQLNNIQLQKILDRLKEIRSHLSLESDTDFIVSIARKVETDFGKLPKVLSVINAGSLEERAAIFQQEVLSRIISLEEEIQMIIDTRS